MEKRYNLYILSYSGKVKLYWNVLLKAWVDHKGNASPIFESEKDRYQELLSKYNARFEQTA